MQPDLVVRSYVTEVRLSFSSTDQNGHAFTMIQPGDFVIVDRDRVIRDFVSFAHSQDVPLDLLVLVDTSSSMNQQFRRELSDVVQLIAQTDGVADDHLSVVSFRDLRPTVLCERDCRTMNLETKLSVLHDGSVTPLYDSVVFAARQLAERGDQQTRKVAILFSDGVDTISLASLSNAVDAAVRDDVAIYSVDLSRKPHNAIGTAVLRALAANTGGRYFTTDAGTGNVIGAIRDDIHATYTVAYKMPSHTDGFHQVRILPTHDLGLQFHCRRGYYYSNTEN